MLSQSWMAELCDRKKSFQLKRLECYLNGTNDLQIINPFKSHFSVFTLRLIQRPIKIGLNRIVWSVFIQHRDGSNRQNTKQPVSQFNMVTASEWF